MEDLRFRISINCTSSIYSVEELPSIENRFFERYDLVIIDEKVFDLHELNLNVPHIRILSNELAKEYSSIIGIFESMLSYRINRNSRILAIGGGVIQDIVTFATSIFFRGVVWDFMPTTLLAMGDSCIGGKSSINFQSTKNVLGNFYPPKKIYIYTEFLKTLDEQNLKSGIGEIYHYAFLNGFDDFKWYNQILSKGYETLEFFEIKELIIKTLRIKKQIIEEDEFDKGRRLFNNWGHTIGHAIETLSDFKIPHGQAVLAGILLELKLLELINTKSYSKYISIVETINLEYGYRPLPFLDITKLFDVIKKDKKNLPGKIAIVNILDLEKIQLQYMDESEYFSHLKNVLS